MARGEPGPESDVDLLAEIDHSSRFSLLDLAGLQRAVAELIGRKVEIATAIEEMRPRIRGGHAGDPAVHSGKSFDDYRHGTMLRLAIERCVQIVSEASRHIPSDMKAGHPEVPCQNVADLGNVLRHAYRAIDPHFMWEVATHHVTLLRNVVQQMLTQFGPQPNA